MIYLMGSVLVVLISIGVSWCDHNLGEVKCNKNMIRCSAAYFECGALLAIWTIVYFTFFY